MAVDNVRACRNCRKLFNSLFGKQICPACEEKMEDDLSKVKDYLWSNKGASIPEVARECNVNPNLIRQWLKEERIQLAEGSVIELFCDTCGTPISTGRFCEKCKASTAAGLGGIVSAANAKNQPIKKVPEKDSPRMRFLDNK